MSPGRAGRVAARAARRSNAALALLVVLVVHIMVLGMVFAPSAGATPRGSHLEFHGWSRDSRLVAYTRHAFGRGGKDQRMHRFVTGGAFAGFGREVGGDVRAYASSHGYVVAPAPQRRVDPMTFEFTVGERALTLRIEPGERLGWRLSGEGQPLASHTFDSLYVDFAVDLYPSPDATQALLVMHLDTTWQVDAAVFPVSLVPARAEPTRVSPRPAP